MSEESTSAFDDLRAGPDAVKEHKLRNGKKFHARAGTRNQRNKIEEKFNTGKNVMDAIATTMWYLAAHSDGSRFYPKENETFKDFADDLDYDVASEMVVLIRKQSSENLDDELTLDERVEKHIKNSKAQKAAT